MNVRPEGRRDPMRPARWLLCAVALLALSGCVVWIEPDDDDFDARVVSAAAELNRHHALLGEALDVAAARVEIARHAAAMGTCLDRVRGEMHDDWRCEWNGMDDMRDLMHGSDELLRDYL